MHGAYWQHGTGFREAIPRSGTMKPRAGSNQRRAKSLTDVVSMFFAKGFGGMCRSKTLGPSCRQMADDMHTPTPRNKRKNPRNGYSVSHDPLPTFLPRESPIIFPRFYTYHYLFHPLLRQPLDTFRLNHSFNELQPPC